MEEVVRENAKDKGESQVGIADQARGTFQEVSKVRDRDKTKEQLIEELAELRRRVAALEASEAECRQPEEKRPAQIGEILVEMGYLTKLQLERRLQKQKEAELLGERRKRLGQIVVETGLITSEQLHIALAEQLRRLPHHVE